MRAAAALIASTLTLLSACSDRSAPTDLARSSPGNALSINPSVSGPATPPFNDEIILRDVTGAGGFGHVKFRQPKDEDKIVYLDTWVRDLLPNTSYQLQRATDVNVNDDCSGTNWLTLGKGSVAQSIATDDRGTGRESLFRNLATTPTGSTFDIHFRVIEQATKTVVLESDCYQFVVIQ